MCNVLTLAALMDFGKEFTSLQKEISREQIYTERLNKSDRQTQETRTRHIQAKLKEHTS